MSYPEKMRAVVLVGPDRLEVQEVPTPLPGPIDVLIRVESCALCSTDITLIASPSGTAAVWGVHRGARIRRHG